MINIREVEAVILHRLSACFTVRDLKLIEMDCYLYKMGEKVFEKIAERKEYVKNNALKNTTHKNLESYNRDRKKKVNLHTLIPIKD